MRISEHFARTSPGAAALTAVTLAFGLLFVGTPAAEAIPITVSCGFGTSYGGEGETSGCENVSNSEGTQISQFHWNEYFVELTLYNVAPGEGFFIEITDNEMTEEEFASRLPEAFSDYTCIPLAAGSPGCRDFFFEAPDRLQGSTALWTNYALTIDWQTWISDDPTDPRFIDPDQIHLLHNIGSIPGNGYDEDMCLQAENGVPNYIPCTASLEPFISSGDTDFQSFTPVLVPVPEPATLLLFGIGATGLIYRRLRS
jgi:hypothetical protein